MSLLTRKLGGNKRDNIVKRERVAQARFGVAAESEGNAESMGRSKSNRLDSRAF